MRKKTILKIVLTALSVFVLVVAAKSIQGLILDVQYLSNATESDARIVLKAKQADLAFAILSIVALVLLNCYIWLEHLMFRNPLTPEQIAERKRVAAERKKARLQERLNKLN